MYHKLETRPLPLLSSAGKMRNGNSANSFCGSANNTIWFVLLLLGLSGLEQGTLNSYYRVFFCKGHVRQKNIWDGAPGLPCWIGECLNFGFRDTIELTETRAHNSTCFPIITTSKIVLLDGANSFSLYQFLHCFI